VNCRATDRQRHILGSCDGTKNVPEALQNFWQEYRRTLRKKLKDDLKSVAKIERDSCSDPEQKKKVKIRRIAMQDIEEKSHVDDLKTLSRLAFLNTGNDRNPDNAATEAKRPKSNEFNPSPPSRRRR